MMLVIFAFFALLGVATASKTLSDALAFLESKTVKETATSKFKLLNDVDLDKFSTLYLNLCARKSTDYPITNSVLKEALKELGYAAESAQEYFFPNILDKLLRSVVLFQIELQRDPDNKKLFKKGNGYACLAIFLLFDYTEGVTKMTTLQAFKLLELIYRFGPKYQRFDAVFKCLFERIRGQPLFKDAAEMLARYYLSCENKDLPLKHFVFNEDNIGALNTFLTTFREQIKPLEIQNFGRYKLAALDFLYIISLNPFNEVSKNLIFYYLSKGYLGIMFHDATRIRSWTRFVSKTDDICILAVVIASAVVLEPDLQNNQVTLALGGLFETLRNKNNFADRFSKNFNSVEAKNQALLNDFMDNFIKYSQAITESADLANKFEIVKQELASENQDFKGTIDILNNSLSTIALISRDLYALDYEEFVKIAGISFKIVDFFTKNSKLFKNRQVFSDGLDSALLSIAIFNTASLDDSSKEMLSFWDISDKFIIALTRELEYGIDKQFPISERMYSSWIEFFERYVDVHGLGNLASDVLKRANNIIYTLSKDPVNTIIDFLVRILKAYQFKCFVETFSESLKDSFGIQLTTVYDIYLSRTLIVFFETTDGNLKTFQDGFFLEFLRYISVFPEKFVTPSLFDFAGALLTRELF